MISQNDSLNSSPKNITDNALDELRQQFFDFYTEKGHTLVSSSPVISQDPSVLFVMAGMMQFKPYFVGEETAPYKRAVATQKCIRAGGKHNDLEDVGRTNRHLTFFEMIGNFSFGDYFKKDAIRYAWEFSVDVLKLDKDRIWVTVHESDDEAEELWIKETEISASRIQRFDDDNYWRMGEIGPCGPSSELFYDLGPKYGPDGGPKFGGENRFVEYWNLVFMQYEELANGETVDLPKPCIDTGMGLERVLAIKENAADLWETSIFKKIIGKASELTGTSYTPGILGDSSLDEERNVSLRIIAEHSRCIPMLIVDGIIPSNEGRGYVLRRIIRRAVRHAYLLGVKSPILVEMVELAIEIMGKAFPEIVKSRDSILKVVENEEQRFFLTLAKGLSLLDEVLEKGDVSGEDAFLLHDTHGFPVDLTREIALENNKNVDIISFEKHLLKQKEMARGHQKSKVDNNDYKTEFKNLLDEKGESVFVGRETHEVTATVVGLFDDVIVLDKTPFYAESGGQIGDTGNFFKSGELVAEVLDTQYLIPQKLIGHKVNAVSTISIGDELDIKINTELREETRRHHTAVHLLHWALQEVLGSHVQQAGSWVGPDRFRFDFNHFNAMTKEELRAVEELVNNEVLSNATCTHVEMSFDESQDKGAKAFFGDKYGDKVLVLEAGPNSIELCGGTHVDALGYIGSVIITNESSIGSNIRRIEGVAGKAAVKLVFSNKDLIEDLERLLKTSSNDLQDSVSTLQKNLKSSSKEIQTLNTKLAQFQSKDLLAEAEDINGISLVAKVLENADGQLIKNLAMNGVNNFKTPAAVALFSIDKNKGKVLFCVAVNSLLKAKSIFAHTLAEDAAKELGGGVGRQEDFLMGGGANVNALDVALGLVKKKLESLSN